MMTSRQVAISCGTYDPLNLWVSMKRKYGKLEWRMDFGMSLL